MGNKGEGKRIRHALVWGLMRLPAYLFLKLRFNYSCEKPPHIPEPFILIANHTTDFDPIMVGCKFKKNIYFVASEHLYRNGFVSKLLVWGFEPIARIKGSTDTVSAMNILRALKNKSNVGLFAEGNNSWNGRTAELHPTTARLVKASHATVVTYRLSGGYLARPRWSASGRRGKVSGRCINVYTPEQLKVMTVDEISDAIKSDIYEDIFEVQRKKPIAYRGKNRAEYLEKALYTCPVCQGVCTMSSKGDSFFCDCGLTLTLNEYGFFEGDKLPFKTIMEWDAWQNEFLRNYVLTVGSGPIFEDIGQSLWKIEGDHTENLVTEGKLALYRDRLEIGSFSIPIDKLYQMNVYGAAHIVFSADGVNYEIKSENGRSGRKYQTMHEILTSMADSQNKNAVQI